MKLVSRMWWRPMFAMAAVLAVSPAAFADDDDELVPGQAVVKLRAGASVPAFLARYQVTAIDSIGAERIWLVSVPVGDEEEFVDEFELDPDVVWTEPNFTGRDRDPDPNTQSIFVAGTYNGYLGQPGMSRIRVPQAQQYATGSGVTVAVLDSGIDALHPMLAANVAGGGWNFVDDNADVRDIGDGIDSNNNEIIDELVGHGTLVAGLIVRVAPDAMILPIKVMDSDGLTTTFTLVSGIYHAIGQGAAIINISMGTTVDTIMLSEAVSAAFDADVLIVASAGNEDTNSPVRFPAGYEHGGLLSVTSTNNVDVRADFSNFGEHVSVTAPGVLLTSTVPGGGYGRASGTSFSAPLAAGGAALLMERYGTTDPGYVAGALKWSSRRIDAINSGYEGLLGAGRIDLQRAMLRFVPTTVKPGTGGIGSATRQDP